MQQKLTEEIFDIIRDRVIPPSRISKNKKVNIESIDTILQYAVYLNLNITNEVTEFNRELLRHGIDKFAPMSSEDHRRILELLDVCKIDGSNHLLSFDNNITFLKQKLNKILTR